MARMAGRGAFIVFGDLCVSLAADRFFVRSYTTSGWVCDFVETTDRREGRITGIFLVRLLAAPRRAIRPSLSM